LKKNLVTGGAGFLGSNIVNELLNLGEEVVVFDNGFRQDFTNIEGIKGKFSLIKGDITIKEDWEKIHGLQHPDFRKKVSVDEIRYFEGWVASDFREKAKQNAHISGAYVPTLDFMKKNPNKRDPLGFPVPRRYKWSDNPFLKIKTYSLEKISISADGKYAKVKTMLKCRERVNPMMVRGNFEFDAQYSLTDYWEKVDGEWVITLLSKPVNTSGSGMLKYYVPNNKSGWGKADFAEINPADL